MTYKILYIEDLDAETRNLTFQRDNFNVISISPSSNIDTIINDISSHKPDLLLLDYILTEGSSLKYCNAPTIASTLRSLTVVENRKEIPIVLMSNKDNIINFYKKDYTSHDLFDYAISKDDASKKCVDKFINKSISFIESYKTIKNFDFELPRILDVDKGLIHSKIFVYLSDSNKTVYEYSRFIFEHIIRCSGLLIGEDILSARLGVSKDSPDWERLKTHIGHCKYSGIFSKVYSRWWMSKINEWWSETIDGKYSLRHYNAEERVQKLSQKLNLELSEVTSSDKNLSTSYWTICKETKLPLDPFDGMELLEEEFKPWQDKEYISIDGYLDDIEKYSKIVSGLDRKAMRKYS